MSQVDKAITLAEEILELTENLPERAEEFSDSIRDKVLNIKHWIEEKNAVTANQMAALDGMLAGCLKWQR